MPEGKVIKRAEEDKEQGKSPSTQAGEFVREEMHHIREGKHGARSPQQAIAIGLSKARRAGVELPATKHGVSSKVRAQARRDTKKGRQSLKRRPSAVRSEATSKTLKKESRSAASKTNLSLHARNVARGRSPQSRHQSAMKAVRTKERTGSGRSSRKSARVRIRQIDKSTA